MKERGLLIVLSAPSGTGKGTIIAEMLKHRPEIRLSISATTRDPRPGDEEGGTYFFKSREEFERMIENGEMLEHALVYGRYYGTPRAWVESQLDTGRDVLLELETIGARKVAGIMKDAILIYILPPTMAELHRRICARGTETEEKIRERFAYSYTELESAYDYQYIVINDSVESAAASVLSIIEAEKCRIGRRMGFIRQLQEEKNA